MSKLIKNLLIALGIILIIWFGYMYIGRGANEALLTSSESISPEAELETQQLRATLEKLEGYKVDGAILNDERFLSLQNYRYDIPDEPTGRPNPFAPVR